MNKTNEASKKSAGGRPVANFPGPFGASPFTAMMVPWPLMWMAYWQGFMESAGKPASVETAASAPAAPAPDKPKTATPAAEKTTKPAAPVKAEPAKKATPKVAASTPVTAAVAALGETPKSETKLTLVADNGDRATEKAAATKPAEPTSDDLTKINGIGPAIAKKLNGLGITSFAQLAELTPEKVSEIEEEVRFPGRVTRDDWIGQARSLM